MRSVQEEGRLICKFKVAAILIGVVCFLSGDGIEDKSEHFDSAKSDLGLQQMKEQEEQPTGNTTVTALQQAQQQGSGSLEQANAVQVSLLCFSMLESIDLRVFRTLCLKSDKRLEVHVPFTC